MSRVLLLDIETSPNTCYVWGLFNVENISHDHLKETSSILCWSAKWLHETPVMYESVQHKPLKTILMKMRKLLCEADAVITYNGAKFDLPVLNKEFVKAGIEPPSSYQQVDLYRAVRKVFRFESNKLDAVCQALGLGKKVAHRGFSLWTGCMEGDKGCWEEMEKYNRNDVSILEKLYDRLLPWLPARPHAGLINGKTDACPACGVTGKLQRRGVMAARTAVYQRFHCTACGAWCRARKSVQDGGPTYV